MVIYFYFVDQYVPFLILRN